MQLVISNTPIEQYEDENGLPFYVKRDDLCCPAEGAASSKIRGVSSFLQKVAETRPHTPIGVADIYKDCKAGWGVSYLCSELDLECYDFYPHYKAYEKDGYVHDTQRAVRANGANIVPVPAGRLSVIYYMAKRIFEDMHPNGIMLPNSLSLPETVVEVSKEVVNHTQADLLAGSWVIAAGSGTIAAGVLNGLYAMEMRPTLHVCMSYSASVTNFRKKLLKMAKTPDPNDKLQVHDLGYDYYGPVDNSHVPFPSNPHFETKALNWMLDNMKNLPQPVTFWNIGA